MPGSRGGSLMRGTLLVAGLVAALAGAPLAGMAQEEVAVPDTPMCDCEIRLELVATLQDADGRAGLSAPLVVERASNGHYLVVPVARQSDLLRFDESGNFLGTIGRRGQGPTEFGTILAVRSGWADSTLVMDAGNGRLAILDPEFDVARSARLPEIGGWFGPLISGGLVVLRSIPGRRDLSPNRVLLLNRMLELEHSFGPSPGVGPENSIASLRRRMAVSPNGVVVLSHWNAYKLEVWGIDGIHRRTLVRTPSWFRYEESDGRSISDAPPPSTLESAPRIDASGRIWTVSRIADEGWRDGLGSVQGATGGRAVGVPIGTRNDYYDSVIEVIDPESGRLIASSRVDPSLVFISDDGYAASYREDEFGIPFVDVWRLTVVGG